jgi:site-specific recombinase XerD
MVIDRNKYMDIKEVKQLRTVTEARKITDLRAGRIGGVLAWMLVDLALSTGLRVSEMAALKVKDIDLKRGYLSVTRLNGEKRQKGGQEEHVLELQKAPKGGPLQSTDV